MTPCKTSSCGAGARHTSGVTVATSRESSYCAAAPLSGRLRAARLVSQSDATTSLSHGWAPSAKNRGGARGDCRSAAARDANHAAESAKLSRPQRTRGVAEDAWAAAWSVAAPASAMRWSTSDPAAAASTLAMRASDASATSPVLAGPSVLAEPSSVSMGSSVSCASPREEAASTAGRSGAGEAARAPDESLSEAGTSALTEGTLALTFSEEAAWTMAAWTMAASASGAARAAAKALAAASEAQSAARAAATFVANETSARDVSVAEPSFLGAAAAGAVTAQPFSRRSMPA
mmetsp:Transcript_12291/g.42568  ORF Transcript_12291/g.42568 Transcript_12291/m.42568 type:complete len:291 (-) Transcript_12291:661-1533(-)